MQYLAYPTLALILFHLESLIKLLRERKEKGKSTIVIVAEGDETGGALKIAEAVKGKIDNLDFII